MDPTNRLSVTVQTVAAKHSILFISKTILPSNCASRLAQTQQLTQVHTDFIVPNVIESS
jgi:hypothetical protein